ncbi:HEAT repeat domain-containing protein [Daejeonella lutea]|uniref:HEAT repeat-containing protein n=1 Tax=Daejeonella lutea TaxID=572036 RepID=A0A1T5CVC1_9SPHI|nr:HEAT repeat domain-containing protein [Daejeonella lutea]SKB63478.1 hypothetical protein SAMN05661099_1926 [Daejeonella lutea]
MNQLNAVVNHNYPEIIRFAAFVAIISAILTFCTIAVIFVNRVIKKRRQKIQKMADEAILETLGERIFIYDSVSDISEKELSKTLSILDVLKNKNKIFRKSMIRLLVYFQTNLTGSVGRIVNATYSRLKLRQFSLKKLQSPLWFLKTQGLTEVQRMKDVMSLLEVYKLVNDKNQDVRVASYIALVRLRARDCFEVMSKEREELSEWQQMMLVEGIFNTIGLTIPSFKTFLRSENRSLVLLGIKLIVDYRQLDAIQELLAVINAQDDFIRLRIIEALGALNAEEAESSLRNRYQLEPVKNKAAILISLGLIASGNSVDFIRQKFMEAEDFLIIKSAAAAITSHPPVVAYEVKNELQEEHAVQKGLINHFTEALN